MSPRARMIAGFVLANTAVLVVASLIFFNRSTTPPTIQGVVLPIARDLPAFVLIDHHNRDFSNKDLLGQWHLISYGYTTCPDVCPTTLSQLAEVERLLGDNNKLSVLFYSVDYQRDTAAQLASYLPFFHPDFLGLTHLDGQDDLYLPFERGLGMVSKLEPLAEGEGEGEGEFAYEVYHGVTLFLINPKGQLQAIFKPGLDKHRNQVFNARTIYKDYLQLRAYFG